MTKFVPVFLVVLCFGISLPLQAQGDVGSAECRAVQLAAQEAVDGQEFRNHGARQKAVTRVTSPELQGGNITAECESCIVSQFARGIPIEEQEACGPDGPEPRPECEPATCATFVPCLDDGTCATPVCVSTTEGEGFCHEGQTSCTGLADCGSSDDCAAGEVCATQTCCGRNVCIPADSFCPAPAEE